MAAAAISLVVRTPLAIAKRRLSRRMTSRALRGGGTLIGIGAATSFLALAALVVDQLLGWWWAERITALIVAAVAAVEDDPCRVPLSESDGYFRSFPDRVLNPC